MSKFKELQSKHERLLGQQSSPNSKLKAEDVQVFLDEIVEAGKEVSSPRERDQLRAYQRYWANYVYEKKKIYPKNELLPGPKRMDPAIIAAIIGSTVTIIAFSIPLFFTRPQPSMTPTFTITSSPTFFVTSTSTFLPTITSTSTQSLLITATPANEMIVTLVADRTSGKQPLSVKFDARDSFLQVSDGPILSCRRGACFYTWRVYSDGKPVGDATDNSSGTFAFTFGNRGRYTVTVLVCIGRDKIDCGGGGIQIFVT